MTTELKILRLRFEVAIKRLRAVEQERDDLKKKLEGAEFWSKFVYPEGASAQDVQNELDDYHEMMGEVGRVYDHVTGGVISKPNTRASAVIEVADEHIQELIEEAIKDEREVWDDEEETIG